MGVYLVFIELNVKIFLHQIPIFAVQGIKHKARLIYSVVNFH